MTDLDAIRARHVPILGDGSRWDTCAECKQPWPCDTAIVLAALDHETANRKEQVRRKRAGHDETRAALDAALAREARLGALVETVAQWDGWLQVELLRQPLADTPEGGS